MKKSATLSCSLRLPCGGTVRGRIPLAFALEHGPVRRFAKRATEAREDITLDCIHGNKRIQDCPWAKELGKMQKSPVWVAVETDKLARLRQVCSDAIHGHRDCPYVAYADGYDPLGADDAPPEVNAQARPRGAERVDGVAYSEDGAEKGQRGDEDFVGGLHAVAL